MWDPSASGAGYASPTQLHWPHGSTGTAVPGSSVVADRSDPRRAPSVASQQPWVNQWNNQQPQGFQQHVHMQCGAATDGTHAPRCYGGPAGGMSAAHANVYAGTCGVGTPQQADTRGMMPNQVYTHGGHAMGGGSYSAYNGTYTQPHVGNMTQASTRERRARVLS